MQRRLIALLATLAIPSAPALAQEAEPEPIAASQEIGPRLGLRMGGRTTPGGLLVGGVYLFRLTDELWSDSQAAVTIGGGGAQCFRDRTDEVICDHGQLDGVAFGGASGLRYFLAPKQGFAPYVRAVVGVEIIRYGDDDVSGFAVPLQLGGGVRARVDDRIAVGADADLHVGFARLNRDIGYEPQLALSVRVGVDFSL